MKKRVLFILIIALCVLLTACGEQKAYDEACALFENGRYAEAIEMFRALGEYSDSRDRVKIAETRLEQTSVWHEGGKPETERALKYSDALTFIETGRLRESYETFASLGSYRDCAEQLSHFTVIRGALVGEEVRVQSGGEEYLRGSAGYTYGADGRAVSRSGFCKLDKYGWFEDFNYHYSYNDAGLVERIDAVNATGKLSFSVEYSYNETGRPIRELYADSYGTAREFCYEYRFVDATDGSESYTEVTEYEMFNGNPFPRQSWQERYCEFGVAATKSEDYTLVNHYGADGRRTDSVQTFSDGSVYVTNYSYDDVYVYTP